jgi:basic amino acid/polyamine antiporter, APA family
VLAVLSAIGILLVDMACCLAVLELRRRDVRAEGVPFIIAGGPIIPLLASAVVIWLLASARAVEFLAAAGLLAISSLLYLLRRRSGDAATTQRSSD